MTAPILYGSIALLHAVRVTLGHFKEVHGTPLPRVMYKAKVKLHGTNAAVQRTEGGVVAQSRNEVVTSGHYGFAKWLEDNKETFLHLPVGTVVYGEWCGPGVQPKVALAKADRKVFAVFSIRQGDIVITEPEVIQAQLSVPNRDVIIIPWHLGPITVDFGDSSMDLSAINEAVAEIEQVDPFAKEHFGVEGTGEGLVMYPVAVEGTGQHDRTLEQGVTDRDQWHLLAFKAKGGKHKTSRTREAAQMDPEVAACIDEFVTNVVTEARLEQAVTECNANVPGVGHDPKKTGPVVLWIVSDVEKECQAELVASGLEWKPVSKAVAAAARTWFLGVG